MILNIGIILDILVLMVVLFSSARFPSDVTAIGLVLLVILTGKVGPELALTGYGSDVVVFVRMTSTAVY